MSAGIHPERSADGAESKDVVTAAVRGPHPSTPVRRTYAQDEGRRQFQVLLIASAISALIMLDSNIVAVALPSIARTLNASFTDIEWVVSAYIVVFAALLLAAGSAADRWGRKRMTLLGVAIFGIASAGCGFATTALMLNLARAVQGFGAALLLTAALAVINHAFTGPARAKAWAFWGACLGIAITSGPMIGGAITSVFGWRWAFLVNLPLCIGLFLAARAVITESRDPDATKLDLGGIVTFSLALFALTWGLIDGNAEGWSNPHIVARLVAAAVLLVAFLVIESRQARPMVDLSLFRRSTFLGSACAMLGYAAGAQVLIFYLPLMAQAAFHFSPAAAGFAMLPFAVPMFLAPRVSALLAARWSGRAVLTLGLLVTATGDVLLAMLARSGASFSVFALAMAVTGSGAGLLNGETVRVMQLTVPPQRAGMASGLGATVRFTGLVVGVASLGALLSTISSRVYLATPGVDASLAARVSTGNLPVEAAQRAFAEGFAAASMLAAAFAVLAAVGTWMLVRASETSPGVSSAVASPVLE